MSRFAVPPAHPEDHIAVREEDAPECEETPSAVLGQALHDLTMLEPALQQPLHRTHPYRPRAEVRSQLPGHTRNRAD